MTGKTPNDPKNKNKMKIITFVKSPISKTIRTRVTRNNKKDKKNQNNQLLKRANEEFFTTINRLNIFKKLYNKK